MSSSRISNTVAFSLWVSICAATPEFIWQGLAVFIRHLTIGDVAAPLLIGTLFAFFVEPLMERVRSLSWKSHPQPAWPAFLGLPISLAFGFVAVCIHESISAYVSHPGTSPAFARAVAQIPEWSVIPFVVTAAWFGTLGPRWLARVGAALAISATVVIGVLYEWTLQDVITTAVPAAVLVAAGQHCLAHDQTSPSIDRLARMTLIVAAAFLALAWAVELASRLVGLHHRIYDLAAFGIDVRFYLGWSLGIVFAPNPLPENAAD